MDSILCGFRVKILHTDLPIAIGIFSILKATKTNDKIIFALQFQLIFVCALSKQIS